VYIRAFPSGSDKRQISRTGGVEPSWRPDGKELVYLAADQMLMAASVTQTADTLEVGAPTPLFQTLLNPIINLSYARNQYVLSRDGRILINQPRGGASSVLDVEIDWPARLRK
jgi:hypothetical protein